MNCSHNLNGTSATVPKDHGAVMAACGALQSARISGLVEAMPPYRVSVLDDRLPLIAARRDDRVKSEEAGQVSTKE
jgi:hypothetical protein